MSFRQLVGDNQPTVDDFGRQDYGERTVAPAAAPASTGLRHDVVLISRRATAAIATTRPRIAPPLIQVDQFLRST